jgi:hypothetical protein
MNAALETDLADLKRLAEEGRSAPLLGGRYLVLAGGLTMVGLLANYAIIQAEVSGWWAIGIFMTLIGLGIAIGSTFRKALADRPGSGSLSNRIEATVWSVGGLSIFIFFLGYVLRAALGMDAPAIVGGLIGTVGFLIYGIGFLTTACVSRETWLRIPGFASLGFALLTMLVAGRLESLLVAAAGVFLLAVVPGWILLGRERKG